MQELIIQYSYIKTNIKTTTVVSPVIIPLLVFVFIKSLFIDFIPRWDSSEYLNALNMANSFSSYNLLNHVTLGYSLLAKVFYSFGDNKFFNLQIYHTVLGALGVYSFYKTCFFLSKKKDFVTLTLSTLLFAVNPLFIATSVTFVPDFGLSVFLLAVLATYFYKNYLLAFIFGLLLVFTKETGVILYTSFLLGIYIFDRKNRRKLMFLLPILIYALYLFFIKGNFWAPDSTTIFTFGNNCRFCFDLSWYNLQQNIGLFWILNLNWIFVLFAALNKFIMSRHLTYFRNEKYFYIQIIYLIYFGFFAFFMMFKIYNFPRYIMATQGLLILIFLISFPNVIRLAKLRTLTLLLLVIMSAVQNFSTFDPVSKAYFGTQKIMNNTFLKIGTDYLGDALVYNTQFVNEQKIILKFIEHYQINKNNNIFIDPYAWGMFHNELPGKIYYDLKDLQNLPSEIYYLDFPLTDFSDKKTERKIEDSYVPQIYDTKFVLNRLLLRYKILDQKLIKKGNYSINSYRLTDNELLSK